MVALSSSHANAESSSAIFHMRNGKSLTIPEPSRSKEALAAGNGRAIQAGSREPEPYKKIDPNIINAALSHAGFFDSGFGVKDGVLSSKHATIKFFRHFEPPSNFSSPTNAVPNTPTPNINQAQTTPARTPEVDPKALAEQEFNSRKAALYSRVMAWWNHRGGNSHPDANMISRLATADSRQLENFENALYRIDGFSHGLSPHHEAEMHPKHAPGTMISQLPHQVQAQNFPASFFSHGNHLHHGHTTGTIERG